MLGLGKSGIVSRIKRQAGAFSILITLCAASSAQNLTYTLHNGPGGAFPVVYEIPSDTPLSVIAVQRDWVLLSDGRREGWLPVADLQPGEGRSPAQIWFLNETSRTGQWRLHAGLATDSSVGLGLSHRLRTDLSVSGTVYQVSDGLVSRQSADAGLNWQLTQKGRLSWDLSGGLGYGYENAEGQYWQRDGGAVSVGLARLGTDFNWAITPDFGFSLRLQALQAFGGDDRLHSSAALIWNLSL